MAHHIAIERELGGYSAVAEVTRKVRAVRTEVNALMMPTPWDYFARKLKLRRMGIASHRIWSTRSLSKKRIALWIESFEGPIVLLHAWDEGDPDHPDDVALMYALKYKSEVK